MAVCADARHAFEFGKFSARFDKKSSVAAPRADAQPDASWRAMRDLRVVQKMHHVMNSGLL